MRATTSRLARWGVLIGIVLGPLSSSPAAESSEPAGSIVGRVQNVVTGQFLSKARVGVRGTNIVAFTDEFGAYRISSLPPGAVVLEVFYTDLDAQQITVDLPAGGNVERNIELTSVARYGANPQVVKLNPYVVSTDKETDAYSIAVNEQRFAPNIKNVMSTDSLGVMMVGSVGEFLKFVPGLTAEYDNADVYSISIRGIGGAMTSFSTDGAEMVNATNGSTRSFQVRTLTLVDISRLEITKVPTPANPADSLAGSVNLIRKSAFEKNGAELRFNLILVGNSEDLTLRQRPQSTGDKKSYKFLPGFEFEYTRPIGRNFGLVLTATQGNKFNEQHISRNTFNIGGTDTGASISRPYLQSYLLFDGPRNAVNRTYGFKADWRVAPHSVLSMGGTYNTSLNYFGNLQFTPNAGTIGTPTPATGVRFSYGPDFTIGAAGRGAVGNANINQTTAGELGALDLKYRFDNGTWRIESGVSGSNSTWTRDNFSHGHFQNFNATLTVPVRVTFSNVNVTRPGRVEAFDANNAAVDLYDINNYRITTATDIPLRSVAGIRNGYLNLRRALDVARVPVALQLGAAHRIRTQDTSQRTRTFNYNGPDGNPATTADQGAAPMRMQVYVNQDPHYGFPPIPWVSASRGFAAWRSNPVLFSQTPAQIVTEEDLRLTNSEYVEEAVSAGYAQAEATLLKNRLKVVTGVRYERTADKGQGSLFDPNAVFLRNPNGTFARNALGARVRRPEAGANGSMDELRLTRKERAARSNKTYDGYYPSLHLTFTVKENLLARAAYARTYGRPDFTDITPRTVVQEADLSDVQLNDPSTIRGTLTVRNPSLQPWTADNYDLSIEYYTEQGGLFSAGVFDKEIRNFFGERSRLATAADLEAIGIDAQYVGWNLTTKFNSGDARIVGAEFNVRQSLRTLGTWGQYFTVFANGTRLRLEGNQGASFTSFIPTSGNWGGSFNRKRISFTARWNHRGTDKRIPQPSLGPDGYDYYKARTTLDLSFGYQLSRRLSFVATVNNVLNVSQNMLRYGSQTPQYARQFQESEYGSAVAVGVKGRF